MMLIGAKWLQTAYAHYMLQRGAIRLVTVGRQNSLFIGAYKLCKHYRYFIVCNSLSISLTNGRISKQQLLEPDKVE